MGLISRTLAQAEEVRKMLRELGEISEQLPLSSRFRRLTRQFDAEPPEAAAAEKYGSLTQAMHQLNLTISRSFYR